MRLPRDVSATDLIKRLSKYGYAITRQSGSHIRLSGIAKGGQHHITIPRHQPIKVGTLSAIIRDIAMHLEKDPAEFIAELFR